MFYHYARHRVCLYVLTSAVCLFGGYYWLKELGEHFLNVAPSLVKSQKALGDFRGF